MNVVKVEVHIRFAQMDPWTTLQHEVRVAPTPNADVQVLMIVGSASYEVAEYIAAAQRDKLNSGTDTSLLDDDEKPAPSAWLPWHVRIMQHANGGHDKLVVISVDPRCVSVAAAAAAVQFYSSDMGVQLQCLVAIRASASLEVEFATSMLWLMNAVNKLYDGIPEDASGGPLLADCVVLLPRITSMSGVSAHSVMQAAIQRIATTMEDKVHVFTITESSAAKDVLNALAKLVSAKSGCPARTTLRNICAAAALRANAPDATSRTQLLSSTAEASLLQRLGLAVAQVLVAATQQPRQLGTFFLAMEAQQSSAAAAAAATERGRSSRTASLESGSVLMMPSPALKGVPSTPSTPSRARTYSADSPGTALQQLNATPSGKSVAASPASVAPRRRVSVGPRDRVAAPPQVGARLSMSSSSGGVVAGLPRPPSAPRSMVAPPLAVAASATAVATDTAPALPPTVPARQPLPQAPRAAASFFQGLRGRGGAQGGALPTAGAK